MPHRPGPLQEISLDFLHPRPLITTSTTKRLHSPPTSPAKRRVLTQERFHKSSRLSEVFASPDSSAKRLGFDAESFTTEDKGITTLKSSPATPPPHHISVFSPLTCPDNLPSSPTSPNRSSQRRYTMVARDLPPLCDPTSIHYPGFEIHRDTHIPLYEESEFRETLVSKVSRDKEGIKENVGLVTRRKVRKGVVTLATTPIGSSGDSKPLLFMTPLEQQMGLKKLTLGATTTSQSWLT